MLVLVDVVDELVVVGAETAVLIATIIPRRLVAPLDVNAREVAPAGVTGAFESNMPIYEIATRLVVLPPAPGVFPLSAYPTHIVHALFVTVVMFAVQVVADDAEAVLEASSEGPATPVYEAATATACGVVGLLNVATILCVPVSGVNK